MLEKGYRRGDGKMLEANFSYQDLSEGQIQAEGWFSLIFFFLHHQDSDDSLTLALQLQILLS